MTLVRTPGKDIHTCPQCREVLKGRPPREHPCYFSCAFLGWGVDLIPDPPHDNLSVDRRERALQGATDAVMTDRNGDYGPPEDNFRDTATLWTGYIKAIHNVDVPLTALDVANIMILLKMAREKTSPSKMDHHIDKVGYAACGASAAAADLDV